MLAELYSLSSGQQQCDKHSAYLRGMEELKQAGFPFFFMVLWLWKEKGKSG